jgi:hypothetical protein
MRDEIKGTRKEAVLACSKYYPEYLLGIVKKETKNLSGQPASRARFEPIIFRK